MTNISMTTSVTAAPNTTEALIPLPEDAVNRRDQLFHLEKPLTISEVHFFADVEVEERPVRPSDGRVESVLEMRELIEELNQHLYSMHDVLDEENCEDEERQGVIRSYMDQVRASIRPTIDVAPQVLVKTMARPWEL